MLSSITAKSPHSLSQVFTYSRLSHSHRAYSVYVDALTKPTLYTKAVKHKCWQEAIAVELQALEHNNT